MTVTQTPAMPFGESDPVICRYSDDLRRTFFQINPYHISCLYKPTFEEHAVKNLLDCDGTEDNTAQCLLFNGQYEGENQASDNGNETEEDSGTCVDEEVHTLALDGDHPLTEMSSQDHSSEVAELPLTARFYESMRLPSGNQEGTSGFKPWKTCIFCHSQEADRNTFCIKPKGRKSPVRRSSARSGSHTSSNSSRQSSATHRQAAAKPGIDPVMSDLYRRFTQSAQLNIDFSSTTTKYRLPKQKTRVPSALSHAPGTIMTAPTPQSPIEYPFHHSRPHSYYADVYRECYTNKHQLCNANSFKAAMCSRQSQALPKARIHCSDVRHGAYLKTTPMPRPSDIKSSTMCFKMAARVGNGSPTWTREQPPPTSSPSPSSSPKASEHQNLQVDKTESRCPVRIPLLPNPQMYVPIVSRSRPTIPSNANGIICASAVETPGHVVSVKGQSLWDKQCTALKHIMSISDKDRDRPHTQSASR